MFRNERKEQEDKAYQWSLTVEYEYRIHLVGYFDTAMVTERVSTGKTHSYNSCL